MKLQLKRSNVLDGGAAKEPTAAQMEYGELAVNYNNGDPAIFLKDSNDNIIRICGVGNISDDGQVEIPSNIAPPSNPEPGNLWFNPVDGRLYVYYDDGNSQQWVDASPDSWNPSIIPDPDGGDNQPGTLDDRYVKVTGNNMTGDLTLGTDKITLDAGNGNATFAGKVTSASTEASDSGTTLVTKDYLTDAGNGSVGDLGFWTRQGTDLYPVNGNTDSVKIGGVLPGAPNITLNATDGSATFAGNCIAFDSNAGTNSLLKPKGQVSVTTDTNAGAERVWVHSYGGSTPSIIYDNGNASFTGEVNGSVFKSANTIDPNTFVSLRGGSFSTGGSAPYGGGLQIRMGGSSLSNASNAFLNIQNDVDNIFAVRGDGNVVIGGTPVEGGSQNQNIKLNADGSASFAGDVVVGNEVGNTSTEEGIKLFKSGAIYAAKNGGNEPILYGMLTDGNTATSRINADGTAMFSGRITSNTATDYGFVDYSNSSTYGGYYSENKVATGPVYIGVNGVSGAKTTRIGADGVLLLGTDVDTTSNIKLVGATGKAEFAGDIISGPGDPYAGGALACKVGDGTFVATRSGSQDVWNGFQQGSTYVTSAIKADGSATFTGSVTSASSFAIQLEADDDTKYTATTDSEGNETRVYNGAVLDVKDRLQKANAALLSLKTAAAAATDFASLQTAIATALANI